MNTQRCSHWFNLALSFLWFCCHRPAAAFRTVSLSNICVCCFTSVCGGGGHGGRRMILGVCSPFPSTVESRVQTQAVNIKGFQSPSFRLLPFQKHRFNEKNLEAEIKKTQFQINNQTWVTRAPQRTRCCWSSCPHYRALREGRGGAPPAGSYLLQAPALDLVVVLWEMCLVKCLLNNITLFCPKQKIYFQEELHLGLIV